GVFMGGGNSNPMGFLFGGGPQGNPGVVGGLGGIGRAGGPLLGSGGGAGPAARHSNTGPRAPGGRPPLFLGRLAGAAGYFLRRHVLETGVAEKRKRAPIVETLHDHWRVIAAFASLSVFSAVTFYIAFVYMVSWLQTADGIPPSRSLEINTFSMVVSLPV